MNKQFEDIPEAYVEEVLLYLSDDFKEKASDFIQYSDTFKDWITKKSTYLPYKLATIIERGYYLLILNKRERKKLNPPVKKNKNKEGVVGRPRKYPFDEMEVGDSITIDEDYSRSLHYTISSCVRNYLKRKDAKKKRIVTRKDDDVLKVIRLK